MGHPAPLFPLFSKHKRSAWNSKRRYRSNMTENLPELLERERELLPMLESLGAPHSELEVLRGDEQLLQILAEDPASEAELERVMAWHRDRLKRVVELLPRR